MTQEEALQLLRGGKPGIKEWNHRLRADEKMPDLSGVDLAGANLVGAMLAGAQLSNADLSDADLRGADLQGADLIFAKLNRAALHDAQLARAHLIAADLTDANLSNADLSSAQLIRAQLVRGQLSQARLPRADLSQANLSAADLTGADMSGATLVDADLTGAELKSANLQQAAVMGVRYNLRRLSCRGVRADACYGHAVFKRDLQDTDWIETYRARSRVHYFRYLVWWFFTDCGRSMYRVWIAAVSLAMLFGSIYTAFPTMLETSRSAGTAWTPFYFSFVTFTTLGFGDVHPGTLAGEIVVTVEVILGYLTLGVLVSILANKVARRS